MINLTRKKLRKKYENGEDLRGLSFKGLNLQSFNLSNTNLCGIDFRGAKAFNIVLENSALEGAIFEGTIVRYAQQKQRLTKIADYIKANSSRLKPYWSPKDGVTFKELAILVLKGDNFIELAAKYGEDNAVLLLLGQQAYDHIYSDCFILKEWLQQYESIEEIYDKY